MWWVGALVFTAIGMINEVACWASGADPAPMRVALDAVTVICLVTLPLTWQLLRLALSN